MISIVFVASIFALVVAMNIICASVLVKQPPDALFKARCLKSSSAFTATKSVTRSKIAPTSPRRWSMITTRKRAEAEAGEEEVVLLLLLGVEQLLLRPLLQGVELLSEVAEVEVGLDDHEMSELSGISTILYLYHEL